MSVEANKINVEEIMSEIRREIKEKGYKNEDVSFSDIPVNGWIDEMTHSGTLEENLNLLRAHYHVPVYRKIESKKAFGPLVISAKKAIRKLIQFYVEPIVADQNENNMMTVYCLQDLYLDMDAMRLKVQSLEEETIRLKNELEAYRGK